jgi:hypothetical protein
VITEVGPIELNVPRDRDASFEPVIVRKRQRRLDGIEPLVRLKVTAPHVTTEGGLPRSISMGVLSDQSVLGPGNTPLPSQ